MNKIVLINTKEFPCPGSHLLHTKKFLSSFSIFNYEFVEVNEPTLLIDLHLSESDIVYVSDHGVSGRANLSSEQFEILEWIKKSGVFPIFWSWLDHLGTLEDVFQRRWIVTGEHFLAPEVMDSHKKAKEVFDSLANFLPLKFAANFTPGEIGNHKRRETYSASFVGHRYKRLLNSQLRVLRRKIRVVYTPPFISETNRLEIFSSSRVILGWHSDANIGNGVVVERVFEGLALGSVVVSDNPYAQQITGGVVEFADSLEGALAIIDRSRKDEGFFRTKQKEGLDFARAKGTYSSVAQTFIERIGEY